MSSARVPNRTLVEHAVEHLREAIRNGHHPPGHHLAEQRTAKELGISTIVVREALTRLASEGLVEQIPRRGTYVTTVTPELLREVAAVRIALEQLVIERAAANWTLGAQGDLEALLDQMEAAAERYDIEELLELDRRFHHRFWQIANSPIIAEIAENLKGRMERWRREAILAVNPRDLAGGTRNAHQTWIDLVAAGEVDRAKQWVEVQILIGAERAIKLLEQKS